MKRSVKILIMCILLAIVCISASTLCSACKKRPSVRYRLDDIVFRIHTEENYAAVIGFDPGRGSSEPQVCEVPAYVEYNGKTYPVVKLYGQSSLLGKSTFVNGGYVGELILPETVTSVSFYGFEESSLEKFYKITVHPDNPAYKSLDGVLFTKDGSELVYYPNGKTDKTFVVPKEMAKIEYGSNFWFCKAQNIVMEEGNESLKLIDNALYSFDETELVYFKSRQSFAIPSTVTTVRCMYYRTNYLYIPSSVTAFLNQYGEKIKMGSVSNLWRIEHIYFETTELPNFLRSTQFSGQLEFGVTREQFEEIILEFE